MAGQQQKPETPAAAKKAAAKAPSPAAPAQPQTATAPQPTPPTPQPSGAAGAGSDDGERAVTDEQLAELRAKLGLPDDADPAAILGALIALRDTAEADGVDGVAEVDDLTACTEGDVECVVLVRISGLRNGIAWPGVGRPVYLPADEAEQYARLGYVKPADQLLGDED